MKLAYAFIAVLIMLACGFAYADPIPDYVLQKDYENCMGGMTPQQDIQRAQYCSCVRNSMRSWDEETYANILSEQARTQSIPVQLEALTRQCAEKTIR